MNLYCLREGTVLKVKMIGELDMNVAGSLKERLDKEMNAADVRHLIFDFSGLDFIDSSGLGVLISCYRQLAPIGGSVRIEKAKQNVYRILELSGIPKVMAVSSEGGDTK